MSALPAKPGAAKRHGGPRRETGMNMIELLVTMLLGAILFAIGIPSYKYVTNSNRVSGEINALLGDMTLARSEAIRRGLTVSVCPANTNGTACNAAAGASWSAGWIVFTDFNGNGQIDSGAGQNDTVLRYQPAFTGTDTFTLTNLSQNFMSFTREGFADAAVSNLSDQNHVLFKLATAPVNNQWTRCLDIWLSGQMTTEHYGQSQTTSNISGSTVCQ